MEELDYKRVHSRIMYSTRLECYRYYENNELKRYNPPMELIMFDLSLGGIGVISEEYLKIGNVLMFTLKLNIMPYQVMAKVVWTYKIGHMYRSGLEFVGMPNGLVREIKELQ
ncbi:PilZ domain-containing protein [Clostridiisalibacter paucivorans]|uniref:PilZ domain-containing protein n=1 Tax=Clostridiisalibacter paucivorans TaxID=408753 RepID=UPI00047ACBCC|nr:PilZ domain-containing protein [Clostridiisalibacter paucivorans]